MLTTRDNRRQTLGVVSNNTRSRKEGTDVPPSGAQTKGKRTIRKGRVSMIVPRTGMENAANMMLPPSPGLRAPTQSTRRKSQHGGDSRRQSMGSGGMEGGTHNHNLAAPSPARNLVAHSSSVVRTDPRPIHDKAFQQECIKKLLNFLTKNGYEYPVSQQCLARPSGRDFHQIVTFMLRLIDPHFQAGQFGSGKDSNAMKMEDEISMNFKALGYPIPLSKTALVAAGSTHVWPTLLAALAWLVDALAVFQEDTDEEVEIQESIPFESMQELEQTTDKVFFSYLNKAYDAFLQGDEQRKEALELALAHRFEQDDAYIEQEIERVTDLNAAIVEQMNDLIQESKQ
jgi:SMC interacting uncharacterized protein involved in chromosome segregation